MSMSDIQQVFLARLRQKIAVNNNLILNFWTFVANVLIFNCLHAFRPIGYSAKIQGRVTKTPKASNAKKLSFHRFEPKAMDCWSNDQAVELKIILKKHVKRQFFITFK